MTDRKARRVTRRTLLAGTGAGLAAFAGYRSLRPAPAPAPDAIFRLIDGRELRLGDLRGRPVLVNFWATTCRTCVAEAPKLARLYEELSPRGAEVIAVAMPYDPPYLVVDFVRRRGLPYPVALDIDATVVRAFGDVQFTPTMFVLAPDGSVDRRLEGAGTLGVLADRLGQWLERAATRG